MFNNSDKNVFLKILILINLIFYNINIFNIFSIHLNNIKIHKEIYKIKSYLQFCSNSNNKIKKFVKRINPKISIISPIFNREKFLMKFFKNLQSQNFKDVEIIFVDDFSKDNSVNLIEEFKKKDERIILIKNRKNKGTFITRNIGILISKGEYLITPDPDDNLSKDILRTCYKIAKKFNYDIIRFNICFPNGKLDFNKIVNDIKNGPIYQPNLSNYIFYGSKELRLIDLYIYNKIIKKGVFIKALNSLDKYHLNLHMTFFEDGLTNYFVHLVGKSLYFLKEIGYYRVPNTESITKNDFKFNDLKLKLFLIYLKFVFENSKNTKYNKDIINIICSSYKIKNINIQNILSKTNSSEDLYFFENLANEFLNSSFIDNSNKIIFRNIKVLLKNIKR